MRVLSVSELNEQIKSFLEGHFGELAVQGEVSRPTYHTSGHLYFSLKDSGGVIKCVMFRSQVQRLRFRLEEGQEVIVSGRLGLYAPRGEYQLYAQAIEPAGIGSLKLAFEQLKKRLAAEGLFDAAHKKPLPPIPASIALVTSRTGAALQDMLRIIQKRWPLLKVYVVDTLVQGDGAAQQIAEAIACADSLGVDLIVVGRGGGSLEDLWAFNEEAVARAIFGAKTPVVSAVGHEIDYLISDFVADLRAPTPSAAMEMVLPDRAEMLLSLDEMQQRLTQRITQILQAKEERLSHLYRAYAHASPMERLRFFTQQIESTKARLAELMEMILASRAQQIPHLASMLESRVSQKLAGAQQQIVALRAQLEQAMAAKKLPPRSAQVVKNGRAVELGELSIGDVVELQDHTRSLKAKIIDEA